MPWSLSYSTSNLPTISNSDTRLKDSMFHERMFPYPPRMTHHVPWPMCPCYRCKLGWYKGEHITDVKNLVDANTITTRCRVEYKIFSLEWGFLFLVMLSLAIDRGFQCIKACLIWIFYAKLRKLNVLVVGDLKPTWELVYEVVDILKLICTYSTRF